MECSTPYRFLLDDRIGISETGAGMTTIPVAAQATNAARSSGGQPRNRRRLRTTAIDPNCPLDADYVVYRLEEAGATLLALPGTGWSTRLRTSSLELVRTALEAYGWETARIRPAVPSADKIDRMDEAMAWIPMIPHDRYVLRRVVGARSLVHPITDRHLFPWRRLGAVLGADHKAVQRWHAQGIALIVTALVAAD
jgi:Domain of unknown function (DUF6362)